VKAGARYLRPDRRGDKFPMVETELNHCLTPRCRGLVHKKKCHSPYCAACRMSRWKESHPIECAFHSLRGHAKERGKDFSLTLEQFRTLCLNTDYIERKGKESMSLQIDRIKSDEGYVAGNVQVISLRENTLKEFRKQFVDFYKNQMENVSYQPTKEEIAAIQSQL
jgi:hypothetical protein